MRCYFNLVGTTATACKRVTESMGIPFDWFIAASLWRETASIIGVPYVVDDDAL